MPTSGLSAVAGKSKEEFSPEALRYDEMRPGCYDPIARLEDMDRSGVLASLCFPTLPRFCGQLFYEAGDREFGFVCLQTYNDWVIDEWSQAAPGRYIPLTLIPLWDPPLAAKEMERCAAKGATAFAFSENPAPLGLPTIHDPSRYWDPVMAAANDLEMVVCMHVGSSSQVPTIAPDSPFMANLAWGANRTSGAMLSWLFSGMFTRYPNLKIALSEGEIGWIPYFLERAEQVLDKQRHWVKRGVKFMDHATTDVDLDTIDIRETVPRPRLRLLHRRRATGSRASTRSARTTSCARPTTRTPTRRGRTASASSRTGSTTSRPRSSTRSCGATPSGCTGSPPPSRRCSRMPDPERTPTIVVDRELCMGSGMCIVYAANTFAHDDETKAIVDRPEGRLDRSDPHRSRGVPDGRAAHHIRRRGV